MPQVSETRSSSASPRWLMPYEPSTMKPWICFLVMTLTTPAMASAPYVDEAPSRSTSTRSMIALGMVERSTKLRWPSSASGYGAMRRPSEIDSVDCTVRPRSAGAVAPEAKLKPVFQPFVIVPALFAVRRCTASAAVLMPRSSSVSELSTVTGEGDSASVRRRIEPVTTTSSRSDSAAGAAANEAGLWVAATATAAASSARRTDRCTMRELSHSACSFIYGLLRSELLLGQ